MIISDRDKNFITDAINNFIKCYAKTLKTLGYYSELKTVMEKIELCIDNNQPEDIVKNLPVYLKKAKVTIREIPSSLLKEQARDVINTVEVLTPPLMGYYPSRRNSNAATINSYLLQNEQDDGCWLKCVIS